LNVDFCQFFSVYELAKPQPNVNTTKSVYAELFGLSKKVIDCAFKDNMQCKLSNLLKSFIYISKTRQKQNLLLLNWLLLLIFQLLLNAKDSL
jgi:hypothetical protein